MTGQAWGTPELGLYFIRHAGRELEVRRVPKSGKGSEREKQYQVIIDGIFSDMAWSTSEAKTKAIKIAERTHKGEPILTYAEREKLKGESADQTKPAKGLKVVSTRQVEEAPAEPMAARESFEIGDVAAIEKPPHRGAAEVRSMSSVLAGLTIQADAHPHLTEAAELFRAEPCGCPADQAGVSFTIRGKLDMDATNALTTIRAAVELLREHGGVECDVVVPSRIRL